MTPALLFSSDFFHPKNITGCKLWLAAHTLGLTDGTAVATWADNSGNGANATQATSDNKPLFKTGIINGLPTVLFDGSDDFMSFSSSPGVQPTSLFIVTQPTANTASQKSYATPINGGSSSSFQIYARLTTNFWGAYTSGDLSSGNALVAGTNYLLEFTSTTGATFLYQNGVQAATVGAAATTSSTAALGKDGQFSNREYAGHIAEVIVYDTVLSSTNRVRVEQYLINKYNL